MSALDSKNSYKPINSFTMKPSAAQIFTYVVIVVETCIFYIMIRPNIKSSMAGIVLTVLFSVSLAVVLVTAFLCSKIDPSDSIMIRSRNGGNRSLRDTMDTLMYCNYCRAYASQNAKHCRECQRCVENFDHHCMWINNCVGSKNYRIFITMIISTCFNLSVYLAAVAVLSLQKQWNAFLGFIITVWIIMVIVFVLWFLLFNLNLLHVYLMCKGKTTYQFIVARKQAQRQREYEKMNQKFKRQEEKRKQLQKKQNKIQQKNDQKTQQSFNDSKKKLRQPQSPEKGRVNSQEQTNSNIKITKKLQKNILQQKACSQNTGQIGQKFGLQSSDIKNSQLKSDYISQKEGDDANFSKSSSNESIKFNKFFIGNKSFNYILSNSVAISPQKTPKSSSVLARSQILPRNPIPLNKPKAKLRQKISTTKQLQIQKQRECIGKQLKLLKQTTLTDNRNQK